MRVNVYAEELTTRVQLVTKTVSIEEGHPDPITDKVFYGVRIYLKSHPDLHHSEDDNDESAVTIWGPRHTLREIAAAISHEVNHK